MTWFRRLYETYDNCKELSKNSKFKVLPICHSIQKAHIEITIDGDGNFKGAKLLNPSEETIIQVTEDSASRTSSCEPHGLADKIQYIAKDYVNYSGNKGSYFNEYFNQLEQWNNSKYSNPKIKAVYEYVKKGTVVKDLVNCAVVYVDVDRNLRSISDIKDDNKSRLVELNEILKLYIANIKSKEQSIDVESKFEKLKKIKEQIESKFPVINDQGDFFVRWRVNLKGDYQSETWNDESIQKCWIDFVSSQDNTPGICYIYPDKGEAPLASKHPKNIYSGSNGAKIVSANDKIGFTYRGRFEESNQAFGVSFQVSQKAHAVLKFLLSKELGIAYQNGSQAYVAWAQSMEKLPKFCDDSYDLFEEENPEISANISENIGQIFAEKLKKKMYGYSQKLGNADNIMVIGIDSATPGRISVIYYKELKSSDFLKRIESWHKRYSWLQYCSKDKQFYGAASPTDIAKAAYGNQSDDKIVRKTVNRILPLILENKKISNDIIIKCIEQASNPIFFEKEKKGWQWRKVLSIACALYKGNKYGEDYKMSLERENCDRNYLYGRLLAVIDYAEQEALKLACEERETNARKYMNEFRNKPYLTWERLHSMFNIGMRHRLKKKNEGKFLESIEKELGEINTKFETAKEYENNKKLNGDYLLAYYCELNCLPDIVKGGEKNTESN